MQTVTTDRARLRASIALIVVSVLCGGLLGVGHRHAGDHGIDEYHCALCQVESISIGSNVAEHLLSAEPSRERTDIGDAGFIEQLASRLAPPLRGPPAR